MADLLPDYQYECAADTPHYNAGPTALTKCLVAWCSKPLKRVGKGSQGPRS